MWLLVALISTGCGSGTGPPAPTAGSAGSRPGANAPAAPAAPAYDPPRQFAASSVSVGQGHVAIADGVAYSYSDTSLVAIDLATGSQRWSVRLPGAFNLVTGPMSEGVPPGVVTDNNGQRLVIAAYYNTANGSGTQQDSDFTQVIAVDPAGKVRWQVPVQPAVLKPHVVGGLKDGRGSSVVLDVHDTVVLDPASGGVRWTAKRVLPSGVDGDRVLGVRAGERESDPWTAVALRGSDGQQLWTGPALTSGSGIIGRPPALTLAGSGRAIVSGQTESYEAATIVLDTATGKSVTSLPELLICRFDERDTAVCSKSARSGELSEMVVGLDTASGKQLWKLPDEPTRRTGVNVTAAFHGLVYGGGNRTAVILDARTGADVVTDAKISPMQVLPGYGIVISLGDDRAAGAYRATG